jgi:alkanesulfonate monooxygenase SsuD/methylene tetrahydromethanopterin reductase-like flavin-dependent oxidoreductase (luciferase family)
MSTAVPNIGVVFPSPLPVGMALPDIAGLAREAERAGFDCVWAEDHLAYGEAQVLDPMCVLAAAAAATETIEVGSAIFVPSLRNLAWALKQVATVQLIAGGRLQLGVALGGASEEEYRLAGFTRAGQRERTDEFLGILAAVRRGEEEGTALPSSARALLLSPEVTVPPLWVGGTSLAALRRAVQFGDGWLSGAQTPGEFKASLGCLRQLADEAGRPCPLAGVTLAVAVGTAPPRELVAKCVITMQSSYGFPAERAEELAIGGPPERVADEVARYLDAGATRVALISDVLPWSESWPVLAEVRRLVLGL